MAEGKVTEALDALTGALDALCQASPLAFRKTVIVDSSKGYGDYAERADKSFKPDEKMLIYVEPVCFGHAATGDIAFKADCDRTRPARCWAKPGRLLVGAGRQPPRIR